MKMKKHLRLLWLLPVVALLLFCPSYGQTPASGFIKLAAVTGTSYTDTSCPDGGTCYYQVFALDANGVASPPATPTTTPPPFLGTTAYTQSLVPATGTHTVTVSWVAATGDVSYVVYRYTPPLAPTGLGAVTN
jgi:fibronectin type 3 domain-containing protein